MSEVKCKYCDQPAKMEATRQCDNCWEVSTRVKHMPLDVLEKILRSVRIEFLQDIRRRGYDHGIRDEQSRAGVRPGFGDMGG